MGKYTKQDIFRIVEEEDVEFIRLQFSDIFGMPKNLAITASHLEQALNNECTFEASAIGGLQDGVEELYLYPDLDTFEIYPWRPQTGKVARMYCDIYTEDGKPFDGDCRQVLKRVLQESREMGLNFEIRPELEFFLFHTDDEGHPTTTTHEIAGFYDVAPLDLAENVRRDIILTLEDMDFEVIGSHHEISPAQHEIDFAENRADKIADDVVTFRMAVKTIAKKHGLYATFLPKPTEGINGSGMHINIYCRDQLGKNLFAGEDGNGSLSEIGQQFVAGLLAHSKAITLFTNPIVNSYKRLIPGFDAPTQVAWSDNLANRSAVISVPHRKANQARIEYRSPDGVCNPYLAFAVVLSAGLDGIRNKMQP
ncbi:MAG: glutamine synthetase family protein, partial [Eubacterium sp.]|nr:glutamine synthetase family protein [Eubacterium sp.]